jgi:hypothetical protein
MLNHVGRQINYLNHAFSYVGCQFFSFDKDKSICGEVVSFFRQLSISCHENDVHKASNLLPPWLCHDGKKNC